MAFRTTLTLPSWKDPLQGDLTSATVSELHSIIYNLVTVIHKMEHIFKTIGEIELTGSIATDVQGGIIGTLLKDVRHYYNVACEERNGVWDKYYEEQKVKEEIQLKYKNLVLDIEHVERSFQLSRKFDSEFKSSKEKVQSLNESDSEESEDLQEKVTSPLEYSDIFKINPHDSFQERVFDAIKIITTIDEKSSVQLQALIEELTSVMITEGSSFKIRVKRMIKACAICKTKEDGTIIIPGVRLK